MKKWKSMTALALACALALSGCGQGGTQTSESGAAETKTGETTAAREDVLITLNTEPTSMHAGFSTSVVGSLMGTQLFDTLVKKDDATGEYLPSLAKSWEFNEEGTAITFELRDDVTFHDGSKMTAEDVVYSYDTIMAAGYANVLTSFMEKMEKVDDTHVCLTFKMPYGPALECISQASLGIFPQAVYEKDPEGFIRNPIGSGPYKFVEWQSGTSITMEANEDYFEGAPAIKNVTFIVYNNAASSAALALENGELDVLTTVSTTDYSRLAENEDLQFLTTPGAVVTFAMFSFKGENGLFADENLRLAVAHAIDKEAVLLGALEGEGTLANALVPSYCTGLSAEYEGPAYDPEMAKEYLAKAGYPDGLDISVRCSANDKYYKPMEIIQAQLAEVGINCTVERMDNNAWFEDVFRTGDYPFQVVAFSSSIADIDYYYEMFTTEGNENFGAVSFPDLDVAYKASRSTIDPAEREKAIQEVQRIMGDQAIVIPICQNNNAVAANKNLKGIVSDPEGVYRVADWSWGE